MEIAWLKIKNEELIKFKENKTTKICNEIFANMR